MADRALRESRPAPSTGSHAVVAPDCASVAQATDPRFRGPLTQRIEERLARLWASPCCEGSEDWDVRKVTGLRRFREVCRVIDLVVEQRVAFAEVLGVLEIERRGCADASAGPALQPRFLCCRLQASLDRAWIIDIDLLSSVQRR